MFIVRKAKIEKLFESRKAERDAAKNGAAEEEQLELEKGDSLAIAIAAIKVFMPILIVFIGGVSLITWLVTR